MESTVIFIYSKDLYWIVLNKWDIYLEATIHLWDTGGDTMMSLLDMAKIFSLMDLENKMEANVLILLKV